MWLAFVTLGLVVLVLIDWFVRNRPQRHSETTQTSSDEQMSPEGEEELRVHRMALIEDVDTDPKRDDGWGAYLGTTATGDVDRVRMDLIERKLIEFVTNKTGTEPLFDSRTIEVQDPVALWWFFVTTDHGTRGEYEDRTQGRWTQPFKDWLEWEHIDLDDPAFIKVSCGFSPSLGKDPSKVGLIVELRELPEASLEYARADPRTKWLKWSRALHSYVDW